MNVQQIAALVNGLVEGNPDTIITQASKIEEAVVGSITFLASLKYEHYAYSTKASALLVSNDFVPKAPIISVLIRVKDVYASVAILLDKFQKDTDKQKGISPQASISPDSKIGNKTSLGAFSVISEGVEIGDNCTIYPQVYLGENVKVGNNTKIYPGVKILHSCIIGDNCIIHANAVIGSDGFGFAPQADGHFQKIAQIGIVEIGNNVEVGANTVIDRASMGRTYIQDGVKLDNLIQIAHNVEIGQHTAIAAQAGIAGSTKIGKHCMIGGQSGFAGHLKIADQTKVQAQSGVGRNVKEKGTAYYGSPAIPYSDYLRSYVIFKNLPDMYKRLVQLEKENQKK